MVDASQGKQNDLTHTPFRGAVRDALADTVAPMAPRTCDDGTQSLVFPDPHRETQQEQLRANLAVRALDDCRVRLMMAFRFLDRALWQMPVETDGTDALLACDGRVLHANPRVVTQAYRQSPDHVARAYLHSVLHCIFRHPFHTVRHEPELWGLACDICVEAIAVQLCDGRFPLEGDDAIARFAKRLEEEGCALVPAQVYRELLKALVDPEGHALLAPYARTPLVKGMPFARDSHALWDLVTPKRDDAASEPQRQDDGGDSHQGKTNSSGNSPADFTHDMPEQEGLEAGSQHADESDGESDCSDGHGSTNEALRLDADEAQAEDDAGANGAGTNDPDPRELPQSSPVSDDLAEEEWTAIARQVETDLQTFAKKRGDGAGRMMDNLSLANRSSIDYAAFLRRFCAHAEDAKINDEEFDYLFYTYGLKRYGNMPLIEPLEYKDEKRLREFVIAIDTSGSCSQGLVDVFLTRTCEILEQANATRDRVNIRIIQCDARVQEETVVTNSIQMRDFARSLTIRGFGGTDFRPVFAHVDELVRAGEFAELRGLIYFTDGYGVFPETPPAYETAFVFVESEGKERRVPPWAMKVVMSEDEIEQMEPADPTARLMTETLQT